MKKTLSLILSALMLSTAAIGCAPAQDRLDPAITLASSGAQANAEWLDSRLDDFPTDVVIGLGSDNAYGVDMTDFENDGYVLRTIGDETLIFGKTADGLDRAVRKYAKAAEYGTFADLDETYHEGYRIEKLTIADSVISEYKIYYPAENNESMLFGVSELQRLVEIACGAKLSAHEGAPEGKYIEFRFLDDETVNAGGFNYRVENGNVIIEGKDDFGCPNAVHRFLQEECGWDGLCYGDSILAESEHVNIAEGASFVGNPRFEYFYPSWTCDSTYTNERKSPNIAQLSYGVRSGQGYAGPIGHASHGIETREWISKVSYDGIQPCYTADYIFDELIYNVYSYVESRVASGQQIGRELRSIDISHPDIWAFCNCENCRAVYKEENNTYTGAIVRFANKVVEEMSKDFDGLKYLIFAYQGTQPPCNTVPDEDIYVTFCTDRCCANHPLDSDECFVSAFDGDDETNRVMSNWIRGWLDITENVYIWHYGLDGGLGSNNHADTLYEDLIFFSEVGVKGVYMCFEYKGGYNTGRIFNELGYALNWDRDMTKEDYLAQLDHFIEKDYGDGWDYVRACMDYWAEGENRNGDWHCWLFTQHTIEQNPQFCAENYDYVYEMAKKAITLANSEAQEVFCIKFFAMMVYQGSQASYFVEYDEGDTERLAVLEERYAEMITLYEKCGIDPADIRGNAPFGIARTCEEEAWTVWNRSIIGDYRDFLNYKNLEKRPMPEKYNTGAQS